jgi:putative lipoprotein
MNALSASLRAIGALAAIATLAACQGGHTPAPTGAMESDLARLEGSATYRERMMLPPGSVLQVTIEDVSRADAPAEVVVRTEVEGATASPIPFVLTYPAARILPDHRYGVRATIRHAEGLLFVTDTFTPLPPPGAALELRMVRAGSSPDATAPSAAAASSASLTNTYWKLLRLGDMTVTATGQQREPHMVLQAPEDGTRRLTGYGGCNRMVGSYRVDGEEIAFEQLAGTLMACADGMETETAFHKALLGARRWAIRGEQLDLFDADGQRVALFESVYLR